MARRKSSGYEPPAKRKPFETEADLCAAFIRWAETHSDWIAYPETGGWDILLVNPYGEQFGIEAKLAGNVKVLSQAIPDRIDWDDCGPDYRGVLIGSRTKARDFEEVCDALGIHCFWPREHIFGDDLDRFGPSLKNTDWQHHGPLTRIALPDYVPDVRSGSSAPIRLTEWKVGALKLIARLEVRGFLTRQDFRDVGVDHRRWTQNRHWLRLDSEGRYLRGDKLIFDQQHPVVYGKILEETRTMLAAASET